jgi:hypothetical protein
MMGKAWRFIARTVTAREFLGLLLMAQAVGYWAVVWGGGRRTTSYQIQETFLPLWGYAAILISLGIGLLVTRRHRRKAGGRAVAGATFVILMVVGVTWGMAGALSAVGTYGVYCMVALLEAVFVREEPGCGG